MIDNLKKLAVDLVQNGHREAIQALLEKYQVPYVAALHITQHEQFLADLLNIKNNGKL